MSCKVTRRARNFYPKMGRLNVTRKSPAAPHVTLAPLDLSRQPDLNSRATQSSRRGPLNSITAAIVIISKAIGGTEWKTT
jgi:hypothetical protein